MIANPADAILNQLRDSRPARYGAMGAIALTAGDTDVFTGDGSLKHALRSVGRGSSALLGAKRFAETYSKSLDPRMEEMPPEQLLAAGAATLGNQKSALIANPSVITAHDWENMGVLVKQGMLSEAELVSFLNILGDLHQQQARSTQAYLAAPNAEDRMDIARRNADIGCVPSVLLSQAFIGKKSVTRNAAEGKLTLGTMRESYPNIMRAVPLIQMIDDQSDILLDTLEEIRTGRPSTNYILAKAHEQGTLLHKDGGRIAPSIALHASNSFRQDARISVEKLHPSLRQALEGTDADFRKEAETFNPITRKLLLVAWDNGLKRGIKPSQNERLEAVQRSLR